MQNKVILLLLFVKYSVQISTPSSPTYDAAVVEFNFGLRSLLSPTHATEENLKDYIKIINEINPKPDIIIFPEMTLNGMTTAVEIPIISENVVPCDDASYEAENLVKRLSCAAKEGNLYVVVNIITKAPCPDPEVSPGDQKSCEGLRNGVFHYNTNVVFDRKGTVISRYRKYNLFGEQVDTPKLELITFTTDFGVTFGTFVCFDLMFRRPAVELVRSMNVTDLIFTSMWFSEAPFLTAVQAQQNWAYSLDVNLLASGANFPLVGSTGTAIYGGKKGAYVIEMTAENMTEVYRAKVYKKIPENERVVIQHDIRRHSPAAMRPLKLKRDQLDVYNMSFLANTVGTYHNEKNVCKDGFCCDLKVNYTVKASTSRNFYHYVLAFNHGQRTFDGFADGDIVACAILACRNNQISSCGVRDDSLETIHVWNDVEISGKFPTTDGQFIYMPTSVDTSILPLQPEQFDYSVKHVGDHDEIEIELKDNNENLLAFGIYGRDFNLDI